MEEQKEYRTTKLDKVLLQIAQALQGLKYGEIIIKVQDGKVIVIDKVERKRICE